MPYNNKDIQFKTKITDYENFHYFEPDIMPNFKNISSAALYSFLNEREMLCSILKRGIDIPGGHKEKADKDPIDIITRETYEETGGYPKLKSLKLIQVIGNNGSVEKYRNKYMLIYTGLIEKIDLNWKPYTEKDLGRTILHPKDFIKNYHTKENIKAMEIMIKKAYKILFNKNLKI